jgi:hypothetical protein
MRRYDIIIANLFIAYDLNFLLFVKFFVDYEVSFICFCLVHASVVCICFSYFCPSLNCYDTSIVTKSYLGSYFAT